MSHFLSGIVRGLAAALTVVISLFGSPVGLAAQAGDRQVQTKTSRWGGEAEVSKLSGHLLRARELWRRGRVPDDVRHNLPIDVSARGRVAVDVLLESIDPGVEASLRAAGLDIEAAFPRYGRVYGRCSLNDVGRLASIAEVILVRPTYRPRRLAGSVTSQGDVSINADDARLAFDVDGSGIKVGVLSDSFHATIGGSTSTGACSTASGDVPFRTLSGSTPQDSGDLPLEVTVLDNCDAGGFCSYGDSDEGAALAEIVHDLAPGSEILFHTAFRSEADFAQGVSELAACGADVIVDDVLWPAEPMFQDGIIAQEVEAAVAGGTVYVTAAGNEGGFGVDEIYVDSISGANDDSAYPTTGVDLHDFGGGVRFVEVTVPPGCGLDLVMQWNQPFSGVLGPGAANDLDLYLCRTDSGSLGDEGQILGCDPFDDVDGALAYSANGQGCGSAAGDPLEILSYTNAGSSPVTGYLAVDHYCGTKTDVRFRIAASASGGCSLAGSGWVFAAGVFEDAQIYGHAAAGGALTTAASFYGEIDSGGAIVPPTEQVDVTPASSLGGDLPFYFDAEGNSLTGAPLTRFKPDLTAPEGVNTTFYGVDIGFDTDDFPNIFGTSAAAPHTAAVAALILDRSPGLMPVEVRSILENSATDIETTGTDALSGRGLVDAYAALVSTPTAALEVVPASLDYGPVAIGATSTRTLTLANSGTADLHVASMVSSSPVIFAVSVGGVSPCASLTPTIPPAGECTVTVTFAPVAASHDETLTIVSNSAAEPVEAVSLTGEGLSTCGSLPSDLELADGRVDDGTVTHEACISITAGPYTVGATGDVTFRAGSVIELRDGFAVNGVFSAELDPLLAPAP